MGVEGKHPTFSAGGIADFVKRQAKRSSAVRSAHAWLKEGALGRRSSERVWERGAPLELGFWERRLKDPEVASNWGDFHYRTDPAAPERDPLVRSALDRIPGESVSIIDVGAGPLTALGKTHPGKRLSITATDPLADGYGRALREAGIDPPVPTTPCRGEDLLERFGPGSFDLAYSKNALDHSVDAVRVITNMVELVGEGRFVVLRHRRREGKGENYWGLHQWNFDAEGGEFIVWRGRRGKVNMNEVLAGRAEVDCSIEREWVVCRITRRRAGA